MAIKKKKDVSPSGFSRDARLSKFWLCKLSVEWPHWLPLIEEILHQKTNLFMDFTYQPSEVGEKIFSS